MRVEFHRYDDNGDDKTLGELRLEDGKLVASNALGEGVMSRLILDMSTGKAVSASDDPEKFLQLLADEYQSPYLWATKVLD